MPARLDTCVVLNLERRPDRWQGFNARMPADWPLPWPVLAPAIDGRTRVVPADWQSGPGAYGCLLSHLGIWSAAMASGQTVLVLEDDAVFCPGFGAAIEQFLSVVPDDWDMLYFGGEHCFPPERIGRGLLRCRGVKKTHAYAITPAAMQRLAPLVGRQSWHIDVSLSLVHRELNVYAPLTWLVGQAASVSDVMSGSRGEPERWWQRPEQPVVFTGECRMSKGGQNDPVPSTQRPPPPQGSGGQRCCFPAGACR